MPELRIVSLPAIRFNGAQALTNATSLVTGLDQDVTIITVATTPAPASQEYSIYFGSNNGTSGANRAAGYYGSELFDTGGISCLGGVAPANTFNVETTTLDSTLANVAFYQNGVATATGALTGVQKLSSGVTMGAAGGLSNGWEGDIAEVLVYDHKLSSSELQQVGLYLANKYALYTDAPPVISPDGGSYTSAQTVTITSGLTGGVIHYTLDGTTPTSSSPTYTGSFNLSASALVSAAVFNGSNAISPVAAAQFYVNDPDNTGLPPAPTGLTVTPVSASQIDLGWTLASLQTFSQIYVYRSTNGGPYELIAVLDPGVTSFDDTNVSAGNSYTYEVGTVNQAGIQETSASSAVSPSASSTFTITVTNPTGAVALP